MEHVIEVMELAEQQVHRPICACPDFSVRAILSPILLGDMPPIGWRRQKYTFAILASNPIIASLLSPPSAACPGATAMNGPQLDRVTKLLIRIFGNYYLGRKTMQRIWPTSNPDGLITYFNVTHIALFRICAFVCV